MEHNHQKRLFIAIDLPAEIRTQLAAVGSYFQHPAVRWTPAQNLHITIHFIGAVPQGEIPGISEQVAKIAASATPFSLTFSQLKTITRRRKPVMVWAEFERSAHFVTLALELQQRLPGDASKTPVPHITLARVKEGGIRELPALPFIKQFSIPGNQIELWESKTGSDAPVYKAIGKFELGGATG